MYGDPLLVADEPLVSTGRQDIPESGREGLQYGKSVTDGTFSSHLTPME